MSLENELAALLHTAHGAAFGCYLRKGRVPPELERIMAITQEWLAYCAKKNPRWHEQPRVPTGNPDGGQWTDGGGGNDDGREIDDPPLEPTLAPWELLIPGPLARTLFGLAVTKVPGRRSFKVGKFNYAGHALIRMEQRRIPPSVVEEAIKHGKPSPSYGKTTAFYDAKNNVTVIWSNENKQVVMARKGKP